MPRSNEMLMGDSDVVHEWPVDKEWRDVLGIPILE